jgi:hypothetical protein
MAQGPDKRKKLSLLVCLICGIKSNCIRTVLKGKDIPFLSIYTQGFLSLRQTNPATERLKTIKKQINYPPD